MVFIYLLGAIDISVRTHFCGDSLNSIHLFADNLKEDPCECVDLGSTDCCKDILVKSESSIAQVITNFTKSPNPWRVSHVLYFSIKRHFEVANNPSLVWKWYDDDSPPCLMPDLYRIRVLRI
jgi:hypothetical protein